MNSALKSLKQTRPELFELLLKALGEDLGLSTGEPLAAFACPNCHTRLEIVLSKASLPARRKPGRPPKVLPSGKTAPRRAFAAGTLNALLIDLARLRKTTTGNINSEFKKTLGRKTKGLTQNEVRQRKVDWLKSEISKQRAGKKTA